MIVAGYALLHRSHVTIDILYEKFNKRTQAIIDVVSYLIFFFPVHAGRLSYQGTKICQRIVAHPGNELERVSPLLFTRSNLSSQ